MVDYFYFASLNYFISIMNYSSNFVYFVWKDADNNEDENDENNDNHDDDYDNDNHM